MNYLSVCSGIEAATVAWHSLGWKPVAFSEIEKFPSQVLKHHYPEVPNVGDMTKYKEWNLGQPINLLVGGTPCQSFSVAGLRKGLEDPRGNLALVYCGILDNFRPKWFVWENVQGVLSSNGGRDFGSFLGAVAELGYGFAYRVLDAQYFGVAQRRKRVFVVGYLGDWRSAAKVLFESESLSRNSAPSRETRQGIARNVTPSITASNDTIKSQKLIEVTQQTYSTPAIGIIREDNLSSCITKNSGGGGETQNPAFVVQHKAFATAEVGPCMGSSGPPYSRTGNERVEADALAIQNMAVRRLTLIECERLQGFPDNYTDIKPSNKDTPDGPRYKALGNSMAVPVMAWIGKRIQEVENT